MHDVPVVPPTSDNPENPATRRLRWERPAQLAASILVLWALLRDVDPNVLSLLPGRIQWGWLAAAMATKIATLMVHEGRMWIAFVPPRPSLLRVALVGLVANLLNLFLPARGGDIAAVAMLHKSCGVSVGSATASVGIVAFLEAAVFGILLCLMLVLGASQWETVIGAQARQEALEMVTIVTLIGIGIAVVGVLIGRRLSRSGNGPAAASGTPLGHLKELLQQGGSALSHPVLLSLNVALAVLQVVVSVWAFALALPAVGITVAMPWLAAAGVLSLAAVAAMVLPPSYGAGPAAASVLVLSVFGFGQEAALAYAAAWWLVAHIPGLLLGVPSVWLLRSR